MKKYLWIAPLLLGTAVAALGQTAPAPARPATLDDVVSEIRAMRADMQRMQEASVRAQLLVARLQVEEQRIAGITRELAQTEEQIRGLEAARNPFTDMMLKQLSEDPAKPEDAPFAAAFKAQLEKLQNGDPALKERQASLSQLLSEEQARWTAFNAQLEALERNLLPSIKKK
jgi:chromosome segregation ATPase